MKPIREPLLVCWASLGLLAGPALSGFGQAFVPAGQAFEPLQIRDAVAGGLWLVETRPGGSAAAAVAGGGPGEAPAGALEELKSAVNLDPPGDGPHVLLVTGIDYPGHLWRETAPTLRGILEKDRRLKVRIVEDPHVLGSPKLNKWDVVLIHFKNWEVPGPGPAARENLRRYVEGGKGLMLTHFACGAWYDEWPEFKNLAGRAWYGPAGGRQHDPRGRFRVEIADPDHPVTKGMVGFETVDELYTCLTGEAPIQVVAKATSKVDNKEYPMAFVLSYGKGRVFHSVLGHDVLAYTNNPAVADLMRRGCAWAAGLAPTP